MPFTALAAVAVLALASTLLAGWLILSRKPPGSGDK
jgi:hypothetical protein